MLSTMHEVTAAEAASRAYRDHPIAAAPLGTAPAAPTAPASTTAHAASTAPTAREIHAWADASVPPAAQVYLEQQLALVDAIECDLPQQPEALPAWIEARAQVVGQQYQRYLAERKLGAPRRFFSCQAHALYFLATVAPTKLVDGAWLYGSLKCWNDPTVRPLILTYLEELGDGVPEMNHVAMFRQLLARHDCDMHLPHADEYYVQGAIQLALGHQADRLLPEAIGFNLGYEQLPLHLLITAYELNELGIDPYYFTLHITIDNAASGHASKAAAAVLDAAARERDPAQFMQRVRRGYLLNELGAGTVDIIRSFDLDEQVVSMLAAKARYGSRMHSDYCRFGGKTVNQWLQDPASTKDFLGELEKSKWILRGEAADQSRFWRLIEGAGGEMFGVFDTFEKQLLRDWIEHGRTDAPAVRSFRAQARMQQREAAAVTSPLADAPVIERRGTLQELIGDLAPGLHHTPSGLAATRAFSALYRQQ